jgi:dGTPase
VLLISSSRFKLVEHRGREVVETIFDALTGDKGEELLPEDFQERFRQARNGSERKRVACDFIAGMTDRYAVEFYARLSSETFYTMFKPL